MKLVYRLADGKDEPALRRLVASVAMPGSITVTFEREPDYFAGMRMSGARWQVLVAENADSGDLAGVLCRSVQERFVNGERARMAYWGQLRIAPRYQGSVFLPKALAFGREVYGNDPVDGTFSVIAEENPVARSVFAGKHRRLLPAFEPVSRILTFGITLSRRRAAGTRPRRRPRTDGISIVGGLEVGLQRIVSFLQEKGREKQLFPVYDESYFLECGYDPQGFIIALRDGRIAGLAGLWDQSWCKQTIVQSYHGLLRLARPFYNLAAPLAGRQPLPGPGDHVRSTYLSFIAVDGQEPEIFSAILDEACWQAASHGLSHLMVGLGEADPLVVVPLSLPHVLYSSTLYAVEVASETPLRARLDGRIPYIEIATL